jgi:head-tail adaptor
VPRVGRFNQFVTLENPGGSTPDGDGGFTQAWMPLSPAQVWASITPATARDLERVVANTVQASASHVVRLRFHDGVTTKTRLTKGPRNPDGTLPAGSREFQVTSVQNPEERDVELVLTCTERVT